MLRLAVPVMRLRSGGSGAAVICGGGGGGDLDAMSLGFTTVLLVVINISATSSKFTSLSLVVVNAGSALCNSNDDAVNMVGMASDALGRPATPPAAAV